MKSIPFSKAAVLLTSAVVPEDVFGPDVADVESVYRALAMVTHPDKHKCADKAVDAFRLLQTWKAKADVKIADGTYGDRNAQATVTITHGKHTYVVKSRIASGDIAEVYGGVDAANKPVIIKVVRSHANNDLLANEAQVLKDIHAQAETDGTKLLVHFPKLVTSFHLVEGAARRQVNIFDVIPDTCTLEDVIKAYPDGIDPRDMAWMFNRILGGMILAHHYGYVHGALTPAHILIVPATHNGILIDWSYSVKVGEKIKAISPKWKGYYPAEVLTGHPSTFGVDLHMAARCASALLGTQPRQRLLDGFLRACLLGPRHRPQDAHETFVEFKELLVTLYGKPTFRSFTLSTTK